MKERPILFSAPMVRAILSGAKTQTRRVVKLLGADCVEDRGKGPHEVPWPWSPRLDEWLACPYGAPGDRLWVRETWGLSRDVGGDWVRFLAGGEPRRINCDGAPRFPFIDDGRRKWRPSIHMPRWVSRLTLEVTDVRVERLNDINEEDAEAEGVAEFSDGKAGDVWLNCTRDPEWPDTRDPREVFAWLWENINGVGSWEANPWVWVVSFKPVTP